MKKKLFWVAATCGWVIACRCFEGTYCFYFQNYGSMNWLITSSMKVRLLSETGGRNYPTTGRNNPEDLTVLFYLKSQGNGNIIQYYVGILNSKNLAVCTVGSLSCCSFTARPGRQNVIYCDCTVVRSFLFLLFIYFSTETLQSLSSWRFAEGFRHERSVRSYCSYELLQKYEVNFVLVVRW